jgi:hypothetical protein
MLCNCLEFFRRRRRRRRRRCDEELKKNKAQVDLLDVP